ncbi:hypothetical protein [Thalassospira marina]|uniref:Uncharacterized protein n=1 Tax=Thalassospira marina TaxID=2048283 RepID=A0ABN5FC27_9PROT|nr:hypothetical protein [Thalassospira marina]AUG51886.1 hypothetical protein CSC3H3_03500 [Thalassospira marina]
MSKLAPFYVVCALAGAAGMALPAQAETAKDAVDQTSAAMAASTAPQDGAGGETAKPAGMTTPKLSDDGDDKAGPVTDNDLYREMRVQAGQYASQNMHQILVGDFTCDGQTDRIAGWVDRDNPDGPFFDVLFVTRDGGKLSSEMKHIPFAQNEQFALCLADDTAPPPMSWQQVEQDYVRDVVGNGNLCTTAVRVEDFICDTPQFYWNSKVDENGDHWVFYRN